MPKFRNPYRFPARSRAAMIAALESVGGRSDRHGSYPFAWNVKIYRYPTSARELEEYNESGTPFLKAWDSAWEKECESDYFFSSITEGMARDVLEDDYSTWPGDDAGQYKFGFAGRSAGWLVLESAFGWNMRGFDLESLADQYTQWGVERSEYTFAEVRKLYRAVMTMESDFESEKVQRQFARECAFRRSQWEEERRERLAETIAEAAADMATAKRLIGELRALRRLPGLAAFTASCDALRGAIANAIGDAREARKLAYALASGEADDSE